VKNNRRFAKKNEPCFNNKVAHISKQRMEAFDGDWQCNDCGQLKKAYWPDCRRCGTGKRDGDVLHEGDWLCLCCGMYSKGRGRCRNSSECPMNYKEATTFVKPARNTPRYFFI